MKSPDGYSWQEFKFRPTQLCLSQETQVSPDSGKPCGQHMFLRGCDEKGISPLRIHPKSHNP